MDIEKQILQETSRRNWESVMTYIGSDSNRFEELMQLFFTGDDNLIVGISQIVGKVGEKQFDLIAPYFPRLIDYLKSNPADAVKRNTMRIFQFHPIPEEIEGELFEIAMNYLKSIETAVAIKAFAMTALRKICVKYPELSQEVIFQIEILVKENVAAGLTNRGTHELVKLRKILENSTLS